MKAILMSIKEKLGKNYVYVGMKVHIDDKDIHKESIDPMEYPFSQITLVINNEIVNIERIKEIPEGSDIIFDWAANNRGNFLGTIRYNT
jgi:hypothetical protein